jgi:predicted DNA-binding WGR domain protein
VSVDEARPILQRRAQEVFAVNAVTLYRTDPERNMRRYYRLDVEADLFGVWRFVREWGRIGRAGQMRVATYPTPAEAFAALERQRRAKERRGYAG